MRKVRDLIMLLGRAVCHQLPERSLSAGGQLPVCARCTGIFIGILISHIYLVLSPRKARALPLLPVSLVLAAATVPLALDGASSYLGLRDTTNLIRLATGLGMGVALPLIYMPMYQDDPALPLPGRFGWWDLIAVATAAAAVGTVLYTGAVASWWLWSLLITLGHMLVYTNVIGLVFSRLGVRRVWSLAAYWVLVFALTGLRVLIGM